MALQQQGIFNSGTDGQSISIIDNTTLLPINIGGTLQSFKWDQVIEDIVSRPLGGPTQKRQWYDGHNLVIVIDRQQGQLDAFSAVLEQEYYAGLTQRQFTVTQTVQNPANGTTTTLTWNGCNLMVKSHGEYEKTKQVQTTIDVWAQSVTVSGG